MNPKPETDQPFQDRLESRIARQPFRAIPADLRATLLPPSPPPEQKPGWTNWLLSHFTTPSLGVVGLWAVAVVIGHRFDIWVNGTLTLAPVKISSTRMAEAQAQRRELLQLVGIQDLPLPAPPSLRPASSGLRPRSDQWHAPEKHSRDLGILLPCVSMGTTTT